MKRLIVAIFLLVIFCGVYIMYSTIAASAQGNNIFYITSSSSSPTQNPIVTSALANLDVKVINSASQLPSLRRLDGIIVDVTSVSIVDRTWLRNQYINGVTVAFIGVSSDQVAELLDNHCLNQLTIEANDRSYVVVSFYIEGLNPTDVVLAQNVFFDSCGEASSDDIQQPLLLTYRFSGDYLTDTIQFTDLLHSHIDSIRTSRQQFRSQTQH